jgi:hypothetical protein
MSPLLRLRPVDQRLRACPLADRLERLCRDSDRPPIGSPLNIERASRRALLMEGMFEHDAPLCKRWGGQREIVVLLTEARTAQIVREQLRAPIELLPMAPAPSALRAIRDHASRSTGVFWRSPPRED